MSLELVSSKNDSMNNVIRRVFNRPVHMPMACVQVTSLQNSVHTSKVHAHAFGDGSLNRRALNVENCTVKGIIIHDRRYVIYMRRS